MKQIKLGDQHVATLTKLKRNEVARINIVQAQVEEMYFMFILSI
jgi:hypothetical protein